MSTLTKHLPRELAIQLGHETVAIIEIGGYHSEAGQFVNIQESIERARCSTVSYEPNVTIDVPNLASIYSTQIEVMNETTLSAGQRLLHAGLNPVILNFASATSPGGGFLSGARAQEEYLARSSGLYACLHCHPMYEFHRTHYTPLYTDYLIYSPQVPILRDDEGHLLAEQYSLSIITCAAVNASKLPAERRPEIKAAMAQRIRKVLAAGLAHQHDSIVLGAWGCGAFGNNGHEIAALFHQALHENFAGAYRQVVFAIVDWSSDHRFIGPFAQAFSVDVQGERS